MSIRRQCALLGINRLSVYYTPREERAENLALMRRMDELSLQYPFYGSRQMARHLGREGVSVGRRRVRRLMRLMGLEAVYRKPRTSAAQPGHRIYPYLLRELTIERPDQVWCADITYIPVTAGFLYLVAVMDWASRHVLAWRLSNTMDTGFCIEALEAALRTGTPEIFNTDVLLRCRTLFQRRGPPPGCRALVAVDAADGELRATASVSKMSGSLPRGRHRRNPADIGAWLVDPCVDRVVQVVDPRTSSTSSFPLGFGPGLTGVVRPVSPALFLCRNRTGAEKPVLRSRFGGLPRRRSHAAIHVGLLEAVRAHRFPDRVLRTAFRRSLRVSSWVRTSRKTFHSGTPTTVSNRVSRVVSPRARVLMASMMAAWRGRYRVWRCAGALGSSSAQVSSSSCRFCATRRGISDWSSGITT